VRNRPQESYARYPCLGVIVFLGGLSACLSDPTRAPGPEVRSVRAMPNEHNAFSTIVAFEAVRSDSARVLYWRDGEPAAATPFQRVVEGETRIATLGISAGTTYNHVVELHRLGGVVTSDTARATTDTSPTMIRNMRLINTGVAGSGYIVLAPIGLSSDTGVIVAFDSTGMVRWYRLFPDGVPSSFAQQIPNGNFAVFLGRTSGWEATYGRYVEVAPSGELVREYAAAPPYYTDNHELLVSMEGTGVTSVSLFGYELRRQDLSSLGGPADALVAGHVILRQGSQGQVEFLWNAWDHFALADWIEPGINPPLDFDHPNSLDLDHDGNYIVSFRNMGAVVKIGSRAGNILWQLGGRGNQFTFLNDPFGGFSAQHSVRVLPNGHLLLYDNGLRHAPPESRAVEYAVDAGARTATLVWEFRHAPALFTFAVGSVQRYANGNTLIGFGLAGVVTEVDPAGEVRWEGELIFGPSRKGLFYRSQQIRSLYEYGLP
jgi:hypothetical protein